jgi:acyl transferase domain-containing protein
LAENESEGVVRSSDDSTSHTNPANYVATELGLGGIHYTIDAACASALYVLKLAQESLLANKADVMLASATCLPEPFFILTGFSAFQALPIPGDVSCPLQQGTTGLTPGEGGSVMVMKRYADAVRDGDHIYGTLLGVRLDNAGTGLPLKPHQPSEHRTLRETYEQIGVSPSTVSYVECHATGTVQGDQAEVDAICGVFSGSDGGRNNNQDAASGQVPMMGFTK